MQGRRLHRVGGFMLYAFRHGDFVFFFFQAEDGIRDLTVTGVQTCALPIFASADGAVWDEAYEVLRLFGLDAKARMLAGGVSQGERKLLDVAVAYALKPKLL